MESYNKLYVIASGQGGYFTAQQAKTAGYYDRLQHYHKNRGSWVAIDRGIFRLRNYPNSDWEDLIHWFLWSRNKQGNPQAAVSHQTAATFHQLADFLSPKIHLTVPVNFRRKAPEGLILHKGALRREDIEIQGGFHVTTPFRTLQDLQSAHAEPDRVQEAIDDAARRGLIRRDQKDQLLSAARL
jgi:predicted transcriptional regulator of viral defense system